MKHIYLLIVIFIVICSCGESANEQNKILSEGDTLPDAGPALARMDLLKHFREVFEEREHQVLLPPGIPPPEPDTYADSSNCALKATPSGTLCNQNFPFNQATGVKILSYKAMSYRDTAIRDKAFFLLTYKGELNLKATKQSIALNEGQIDSLAHLMYNFGYKGSPVGYSLANCLFHPRNAIVFYDADEKPFAYLEICFGCEQFMAFPKRFQTGEFCSQKFELLKAFFRQAGIIYGLEPPYDKDEVLILAQK